MNDEITLHQVIIRFYELDKLRAGCISRLDDFTNYDGLAAANNPIDTISVDIRSYNFDHDQVREELNRFAENVSFALGARCKWAFNSITYSSKDVAGWIAIKPVRDVSYTIEILK